ncbi:hypothetical protein TWF696_000603 [Orbilia brochopaga]|uniref:Terpene synthase n=1 Tax=Orbilia brochopaga TaxID=3140254 RepID=A0AAV9VEH6_9PEZI
MVEGSAATLLTPTLVPEVSGDTKLILVEIPDFFKSVTAAKAAVNPWHTEVKMAGHAWAAEILGFSEKVSRKILEADFALLAAAFIPFASKEQLRGLVDWLYWVAMFDDRIDEGDLRNDTIGAAAEILESLAILDDEYPAIDPKDNPVRYLLQVAWKNFSANASDVLKLRFKEHHRLYMIGLLKQTQWMGNITDDITLDRYIDIRRGTIGGYPTMSYAEWANDINLPRDVINHQCIETLRDVANDLIWISNDIISLRKDLAFGTEANLIILLLKQGYNLREAMGRADEMLDECYKTWDDAFQAMPKWGEEIDRQVLRLVEAYRVLAMGNIDWSFRTTRFLGNKGAEVRATRILAIPEEYVRKYGCNS